MCSNSSSGEKGADGGMVDTLEKVGASRRSLRVQVHYNTHLSYMYLQDRDNSRTLLAGMVLPILQGHVLYNNWHL